MFASLSIVGLGALLGWIGLRLLFLGRRPTRGGPPAKPRAGRIARLVGLGLVLCVIGLAATGFYASLVTRAPIGGRILLWHVAFGGAFCALLAAFALRWAAACGAGRVDAGGVRRLSVATRFWFWIMLAAGLASILTILLSMIPLFGQEELRLLIEVHRWSALATTVAIGAHFCLRWVPSPGDNGK